ncbi:hypothetical protein pEaSNUABM35_00012 [Erwinia phage pEa_SNUABM_35]|uniref:Uncharacterized protein n=1 Tax=Erwinia phage pEa_SNUABM_35 TaxID=2869557 RepID=A0AAE7XRH0_9CAUD|nr:hypothetical protein MPK65_gp012 [Erwinia phage pEa_SNUABM_35]QZE59929.1 hypothetical protein pEaSNUABM35_00012 [Erwinia phage pEa_SNUABM_35]QZE60265.1 hypothetical protein pEaSNUABM36_00012 [Erwinia phage pEa_SNUABM_36]
MTDKITQLAKWYDAAKTAFKMGQHNPNGNAALLLSILARLNKNVEVAAPGPDHDAAEQERAEFLDDLAAEVKMYELIRKRFNSDLYPGITVSEDVKVYVALMADRPGSAVMAMTFLHLARCYTLKDMIINFLPNGFPGEDALGLTWSIQKTDAGNLVDDIDSVNSLYTKMYNSGDK